MRRVLGVVCIVGGCFLAPNKPAAQQQGDAGADTAAGGDGSGSNVGTCAHWGPWAGETPIANLAGSGNLLDEDPALSPDGTHLVFTQTDNAAISALVLSAVTGTTFAATSTVFTNASSASWSPDGQTLFFLSSSSRSSSRFNGSGFGVVTVDDQLVGLSPPPEGRLTFTGDGTRMYYEVTDGSGETHTYGVSGTAGTHWNGPGVELSELDTGSPSTGAPIDQQTPWISSDDLEIFFSTSNGNAELRTAARASRTEPFSAPMPIPAITTDGWRPTVTRDGTLMVYSGADGRLYYTTRACQ